MIGEIKDEYGVTMRNARDKLEFKLDAGDRSRGRAPADSVRDRVHAAAGQRT